jgi:tetratricopeptide (TPR) repeat protein
MSPEEQKVLEYYNLAQEARQAGDSAAALNHLRSCLEVLRLTSDRLSQGRVCALMGDIHTGANEPAEALACFELAATCLTGPEARRERLMVMFHVAQAARNVGQEARALETYDEIIRITQSLRDVRSEGMARALRGEVVFNRGGFTDGLHQMLLGLTRLRTAKAPEMEMIIEHIRHYGGQIPRQQYEELLEDGLDSYNLKKKLLAEPARTETTPEPPRETP